MRLVHVRPDLIELRGRDALRPPFWVGAGLLLGPCSVSLLGPAPFTVAHVLGLVALGLVGSGLTWLGWPRLRWGPPSP